MEAVTVPPTTRELAHKLRVLRSPVTIRDSDGHVDKSVVYIKLTEELIWINNTDDEVIIVFDLGSPFEKKEPIVVPPNGGQQCSGLPTARGQHKYTVIGAAGNNDPAVIIEG